MSQQTSELVVHKTVTVTTPVAEAFRVFTEGIASWWPLRMHAVDSETAETVVLEGRVGGRLYERTSAGAEHPWGTVTAWEPPSRVAFTWHPDRDEESAQQIEVTFAPEARGTRVDLRHTGWDKLGEGAPESMASYDGGWGKVLGFFVAAADGQAPV